MHFGSDNINKLFCSLYYTASTLKWKSFEVSISFTKFGSDRNYFAYFAADSHHNLHTCNNRGGIHASTYLYLRNTYK